MSKTQPGLLLVLILLFSPVSQLAFADDAQYENGIQAYRDEKYDQALEILKPLAESGQRDAQYYVARMYEKGLGVPKDQAEMRKWYQRSADAGHPKAEYKLGVGYAKGYAGLEQNDTEAGKWFLKSAEQGYRKAMKAVARGYKKGQFGFPKDKEKAKYWAKKAEK